MLIEETDKHVKKILLLVVLVGFSLLDAYSLELAISGSVFNEELSAPSINPPVGSKWHPGVQFGLEAYYHKSKRFRVYQSAELLAYYHAESIHGSSLALRSEIAGAIVWNSIHIEALAGLGYMHSWSSLESFYYDARSGTYKHSILGRPGLLPSAALGIGYDFTDLGFPARAFIRYDFAADINFQSGNSYPPLLPITMLHVGLCFYLGGKE